MAEGKIEALTEEQERLLGVYERRWIRHGLDCSPMNWKAAVKALDSAYEVGGLKPPAKVVACGSPMGMMLGRDYKTLRGRGKAPKVPNRSNIFYGQHNAGWAGRCEYYLEAMGLVEEIGEIKDGLIELCKQAGWVAMYEEVAYICSKTSAVRTNAEGGLHSLELPAIEYPDGEKIWAVSDVVIPDEWIPNKATLDPRIALEWPNVEQRAVAGHIIGWDRVLETIGAKVVDQNPNKYIGTLLEAELDGMKRKFLRVTCPTGREMTLSVSPELATAKAANDWTYGGEDDGVTSEGRT